MQGCSAKRILYPDDETMWLDETGADKFCGGSNLKKYLLYQTNFDLTLPKERRVQAKLAVKDECTFDFAELSPAYTEHELEIQLVNNIRAFLIELCGDFAFIGNQYHLVVGSRDLC